MGSATTDRRMGLAGNTAYKTAATALASANIVLSGEQTVGGVAVKAINAAGVADRVLCISQTDTTKNGLWDVSTGTWTRSVDADGNYDWAQGAQVMIAQGAAAFQIYVLTTANPITVGTTPLAFSPSLNAGNMAALGAPSGASLVGFSQSFAGAAGSVARKLQCIVSPRDAPFNAVGDGVADDTAAVLAMLTAYLGTSIEFNGEGRTYKITANINAQLLSNTHWRLKDFNFTGYTIPEPGVESGVINITGDEVITAGIWNGTNAIELQGLYFFGATVGVSGNVNGVMINNFHHVLGVNTYVYGFSGTGIYVGNSKDVNFTNSCSQHNGYAGMRTGSIDGLIVTGGHYDYNGLMSATFTGTIVGTILTVSGVVGTIAAGWILVLGGVITAYTITGGAGSTWTLSGAPGDQGPAAMSTGPLGAYGIANAAGSNGTLGTSYTRNVLITGVTASYNWRKGIDFHCGVNVRVVGNTVVGNSNAGIYATAESGGKTVGNVFIINNLIDNSGVAANPYSPYNCCIEAGAYGANAEYHGALVIQGNVIYGSTTAGNNALFIDMATTFIAGGIDSLDISNNTITNGCGAGADPIHLANAGTEIGRINIANNRIQVPAMSGATYMMRLYNVSEYINVINNEMVLDSGTCTLGIYFRDHAGTTVTVDGNKFSGAGLYGSNTGIFEDFINQITTYGGQARNNRTQTQRLKDVFPTGISWTIDSSVPGSALTFNRQGSQVVNSGAAVGAPKGWSCTVSGQPGTWVSQGNL